MNKKLPKADKATVEEIKEVMFVLPSALILPTLRELMKVKDPTREAFKEVYDWYETRKEAVYPSDMDIIEKVVCEFYGIPVPAIREKTRNRKIVRPRQATYWMGCKFTSLSLAEIGGRNNQDHATVINARRAVTNELETSRTFFEEMKEMCDRVTEAGLVIANRQFRHLTQDMRWASEPVREPVPDTFSRKDYTDKPLHLPLKFEMEVEHERKQELRKVS